MFSRLFFGSTDRGFFLLRLIVHCDECVSAVYPQCGGRAKKITSLGYLFGVIDGDNYYGEAESTISRVSKN